MEAVARWEREWRGVGWGVRGMVIAEEEEV